VRRALALLVITALAGCAQPRMTASGVPIVEPKPSQTPPATMQWLYGSAEAAALSVQAYHAFRDHVLALAKARPRDQMVLAAGARIDAPRFVPCAGKPLAVVLDVDETALLNLGYEYDEALGGKTYDAARWEVWELSGSDDVAPVPGAVTALRAIRQAGVTVVFNSNRKAANAQYSEAAIDGAGLGPAKHGDTLWLQGDVAAGSAKDPRRGAIAERYCVIAMAGDQLGDFSDMFNAKSLSVRSRRDAASSAPWARLWGAGWFLLPNPVYGPGVRGNFDDVFPADKRWTDPRGE
jgi:5'-nucleotidase (lipoprotein e(P4) family)